MPIVNGQLRISDDELDRVALAFLKEHQPGVLRKPTRTDLQGITTVVETRFGFHFSVADLAYRGEAKLLGSTDFANHMVTIDRAVVDDLDGKSVRFPFVLAHEIAHCLIHSEHYELLKSVGVFEQVVTDTKDEITGKKRLETERDFIEHQANVFAACILVPSMSLKKALVHAQNNLGINSRQGRIYVDHHSYSQRDLYNSIFEIAKIYLVSKSVVRVRLKQLDLIVQPSLEKLRIDRILDEMLGPERYDD